MTKLARHPLLFAALALSGAAAATDGPADPRPGRFALQAVLVETPVADQTRRFALLPAPRPATGGTDAARFSLLASPAKGAADCAPAGTIFRDGFED